MTKCKLGDCPRKKDDCCMECELLEDCKDSDYACDAECELGRIVVPKEIRDTFGWDIGTPMEMYTDGKSVVLKAYPMEICVRCGAEIKEDHYYCPRCGKEKRPT